MKSTQELHDVRETLCYGLDGESNIQFVGMYRDLFQLLINLGHFYLNANKHRKDNLIGLGNGWDLSKLLLVGIGHPLEWMIKL